MLRDIQFYKSRLLKAKAEAKEQLNNIEEGGLANSLQDSISELSSYDNHPADIGSEVFERSKDFALRDMALVRLSKIDRALEKITEGNYGLCDRCGQEIGEERLAVEAETNMCIECRREFEGRGNPNVRPVEEEVVAMPYGGEPGTVLGEADQIEYDGEDAWQDAAQYAEHAEQTEAGAYYGGTGEDAENTGEVEPVEGIPYFRGADGMAYEDVYGKDDEASPEEVVRGDEGWDRKL